MAYRNSTDATPSKHAGAWGLDPEITMLNHGAFGACPRVVLQRQCQWRDQMEREPVRFFVREMPPLLDHSRRALARLVGAEESDLVFVRNATSGVNAVLRSLRFRPGDELLVTDHDYNACRNAARYVAQQSGAKIVVAAVPLPVEDPQQVIDAIVARATDRTRLALIDHVTSPTGIVFPLAQIVEQLARRGIDTLVDGAHGPGMVPLDMRRIGAAYYAGNCHKWLCAPKGAGFLHVRPDRQAGIQPVVISHGFNTPRPGYSPLQDAFDWTGTDDPTGWLCVGEAIAFLDALIEGGIEALMQQNHRLALAARQMLSERLGLVPVCPESMIGSLVAFRLPGLPVPAAAPAEGTTAHPLGADLLDRFGIEVPVYCWPPASAVILRISAQAYNSPADYERLAEALGSLLQQ